MQDENDGTSVVTGVGSLHTQYNRIADINHLIDPSTTNIIDTYVLVGKTITIHLGIGHCLIQD